MSGICGICEPGRALAASSLEPMLTAVALANERQCAVVCGDSVAMAVAPRWSFQQVGKLRGIYVAVDADLVNRHELENSARNSGFDTPGLSFAQLVAHLYLERGLDFVQSLDGAFSLALWDERTRRLVLCIDRIGVNALYWCRRGDQILFASRVGAIRAMLGDSARLSRTALMQYMLFSAVPAPLTAYEGVEKLQPGQALLYEKGELHQCRYWDLNFSEDKTQSEVQWARAVRETMRTAVHRHMNDGIQERMGAYLSGGTDSSSVVAFMAEQHSPVNTFTIYFEDERYSEISFARTTANRFETRHHELRLSASDAFDAIPKITQYFDEPFANSSAIGGYYCARQARESGVDILLAGDGGDELFAGNERYAMDKRFALYHHLWGWTRERMIEPLARALPQNDGWLSLPHRYIRRANIPLPRRIHSYGLFLSTPPERVFEPDFLKSAPPAQWMDIADGHYHVGQRRSELNRLLYMDVKMTLADNDLRKVLGTAELAGVRARFPLVDYHLAELSGRIPSSLKLKGFQKRYIFKQAMKEILPAQVLYKKKHGFGVPVALWFLEDPRLDALMKDVLNDPRTRQRGYFRPAFFDEVIRRHREEDTKNYGEILWYLLVLELWHREHLENPVGSVCAH